MQLVEALRISDMDSTLDVSCGTSSPVYDSRIGTSGSQLLSPPTFIEYRIDDTDTLEEGRRSDMEQELYRFYESLSEKAFDLSMTDLVILKPVGATDGLPVEENSAAKALKDPAPTQIKQQSEVASRFKKKTLSSWHLFPPKSSPHSSPDRTSIQESIVLFPSKVPQFGLPKSFPSSDTSRREASAQDNSIAFLRSLSSKSHRRQSARISPKVTPMSSPRSSSASANISNGVNIMTPRTSVSPTTRQKIPGIKMDASNQCSICSSYTHFFKSRCEVCGRIYCSYCMQESVVHMPNGTRCRGICAERTSRRSIKKSANSCWPFGSKKIDEDGV